MTLSSELHKKIKGCIAVIDFGGQYAHLIASKIRRLGAYSEVFLPDDFIEIFKEERNFYKGIILSGGPFSVYDKHSPTISYEIFKFQIPILGICYGHQWLMHHLKGKVKASNNREYGPARLKMINSSQLLKNIKKEEAIVWMSHGDEVIELPYGFKIIASTPNCEYAFVSNEEKKIFGVQFHPEVHHTEIGYDILQNFIEICGLTNTYKLENYLNILLENLKKEILNKTIFFLVSGGVDSTVAFSLIGKITDQVYGVLIDTGFLRLNEAQKIQKAFQNLNIKIHIEDRSDEFFVNLKNIYDPELKRKIIGELFIKIQNEVIQNVNLDEKKWLIGQGTIYPDTIESGNTKFSHTIKTHHNRVDIVQKMIEEGLIIEPIKDFYKDEVRQIGKILNLPEDLINKHPFPGPGLAIRCLCNNNLKDKSKKWNSHINEIQKKIQSYNVYTYLLPIRSVGVQGDQRTYAQPIVFVLKDFDFANLHFSWDQLIELGNEIINNSKEINRALLLLPKNSSNFEVELIQNVYLTKTRIDKLRIIDNLCYEFLKEKNIYNEIWQMPIVQIPLKKVGSEDNKESIVIRPIQSIDAMTASVYKMSPELLKELVDKIYETERISYIFYDITSKPPGTIEWE